MDSKETDVAPTLKKKQQLDFALDAIDIVKRETEH